MAFTKFARSSVLEAEVAGRSGGLMKNAHRHTFDYTPREGYLYVRSRAISSRTNDNFDTFPSEEIKKAWATFVGKPVFVNHHNDDHRRARGVVIDAALHEDIAPDGTDDTWVEVLMEIDAITFPKLAKAILAGDIERTSMGCDVAFSVCSVCGNKATTPMEYCSHIPRMKGQRIRRRTASGSGTEDVLVHELCHGLSFFENSVLVEDPADPTAYFIGVDDRGVGGGYTGTVTKAASKADAKNDGDLCSQVSLGTTASEFGSYESKLSLFIGMAEETMKRQGLTGRKIELPVGRQDDPQYQRAIGIWNEWARKVSGLGVIYIRTGTSYDTDYGYLKNNQAFYQNGTIVARQSTDELTLLHEIAHAIQFNEGLEAGGHNVDFARIASNLYHKHLGKQAGDLFDEVSAWKDFESGKLSSKSASKPKVDVEAVPLAISGFDLRSFTVNGENYSISTGGDAVGGGQYNGYLVAYDSGGRKAGYIDYMQLGDEVQIAMIEVEPEFRRKGIATGLLGALKVHTGSEKIDSGMLTDDGGKWWNSVNSSRRDRYSNMYSASLIKKKALTEDSKPGVWASSMLDVAINASNGDGDCFPSAVATALKFESKNPLICHGQPIFKGNGEMNGQPYDHAWVEIGSTVVDRSNGRKGDGEFPKELYYDVGNIDGASVRRYTIEEAMLKISSNGHWGPWR